MRIFGNNKQLINCEWFKLLQFGAPNVQDEIKEELNDSEFEVFQQKLIEDTGKSYDELKEFWTLGKNMEEKDIPKILYTSKIKYIIIHLDSRNKNYIGFINEEAEVYEHEGEFYVLLTELPQISDLRPHPIIARPIMDPTEEITQVFQTFFHF